MNNYHEYDAIELAHDDTFIKWVRHPEQYPELVTFWEAWLVAHPERASEVADATLLVEALDAEITDEQQAEDRVWERVQQSVGQQPVPMAKHRSLSRHVPYAIAASVVLLLVAAAALWLAQQPGNPLADADQPALVRTANDTPHPQTVILPDSSSVVLYPGSTLSYAACFADDRRDVQLGGQAFFEVRKDPTRPFVVHSERVVTTVLGTSFLVSDAEGQKISTVQVKTGQVKVAHTPTKASAANASVVLHPYQQATLSSLSALTASEIPRQGADSELARYDFTFRDAPLQEVFARLGQVYQINIMYDDQILMDDRLNADLEDMPLTDKIRVVCKVLDLSYSYDGSTVHLQAP
jgi:ferric-dicitrate binding protein FerR (iron transport regulator)